MKIKVMTTASRIRAGWMRLRLGLAALAIAVFPVASIATSVIHAKAISDITPMEFTELTIETNSVDVSNSDVQVALLGYAQDDISGYGSVEFFYTSPSGVVVEGDSGTDGENNYYGWITFHHYSEPGLWRPTFTLTDNAGNIEVLDAEELVAQGFNIDVTISDSNPDTIAPTLLGLSLQNQVIDTGTSTARNLTNLVFYDDLSGPSNEMQVKYTSPSGQQTEVEGIPINNYPDPNMLINPLFVQYSETGIWTIQVTLKDHAGNTSFYDTSDLSSLGFASSFEMVGNGDTTPVTIESLDFDAAFPAFNNIPNSGAAITLLGHFTDNLSGFERANIIYRSATTTQVSDYYMSASEAGPDYFQLNAILPPYAAVGLWLPELVTLDMAGNAQTFSHSDLLGMGLDFSVNLLESDSEYLDVNGTITSDSEGDGASETDPVESSVTTPLEGDVSIVRLDVGDAIDTNSFHFFDQQISISAPESTPEEPLTITFTLDSSKLEGKTAEDIVVFRNGVELTACTSPTIADPDPCVSTRQDLPDGDVQITVLTSSASVWTFAYILGSSSYSFEGFMSPVKASPMINNAKAGSTIPVKFSIGGDFGLNILGDTIATSEIISCDSREPLGEALPISFAGNTSLKYSNETLKYQFNWSTLKQWRNSCRQLTLEFDNGEKVTALFQFN